MDKKDIIICFVVIPIFFLVAFFIPILWFVLPVINSQNAHDDFSRSSSQKYDPSVYVCNAEDTLADFDGGKAYLPTEEEIAKINARLPLQITDWLMFTNVEYDAKTMVQTFYYDYMQDVDESLITQDYVRYRKRLIVNGLKEMDNLVRMINAGVTNRYVYRSRDKRTLYEIKVSASDLKNPDYGNAKDEYKEGIRHGSNPAKEAYELCKKPQEPQEEGFGESDRAAEDSPEESLGIY